MATGMNTLKRHHFHKVAYNMNNYLVPSGHHRYSRNTTDQEDYSIIYPQYSPTYNDFGSLFASGLKAMGMPTAVIEFGYGFGSFFDYIFYN